MMPGFALGMIRRQQQQQQQGGHTSIDPASIYGTGPGQPPPATPGQQPVPGQPVVAYGPGGNRLKPGSPAYQRWQQARAGTQPGQPGGMFGGQVNGGAPPAMAYQPPQLRPQDVAHLGLGQFQPQNQAQPQGGLGAGASSGIRQQMMQQVLGPLMQPNYGVQQINPAYLTGAMPTQGRLPADALVPQGGQTGGNWDRIRAGFGPTPTGPVAL